MLFQLTAVFMVWFLAPLVMCATSWIYWRASGPGVPIRSRLLVALHGILGTLVFSMAFLLAYFGKANPHLREPYILLWLLPLTFVGVSLWCFKGPKRAHLLLIPLMAAMAWAVIVGYTIVGDGK